MPKILSLSIDTNENGYAVDAQRSGVDRIISYESHTKAGVSRYIASNNRLAKQEGWEVIITDHTGDFNMYSL